MSHTVVPGQLGTRKNPLPPDQRFHQINKETGNRVRYRKVDEDTGDEVDQAHIIKGY